MAENPRRLGRGLEALLGAATPQATAATHDAAQGSPLKQIPLDRIRPNPYQPRREFREEDLVQLEASLQATGLLQPITVRPVGDKYELIAGERRLRAASRLGWSEIPAVVKELDDRTTLTLALVENLQRTDLNAIEEAEGFNRLIAEFGLTQQEVASTVGKDRSTVANSLRLLSLPASIRRMVQDAQLSAGHARALLGLPDERVMVDLAREIASRNLSVRDVERRVKQATGSARQPHAAESPKARTARGAELRRLTDLLRRRLQTDVAIDIDEQDRGTLRLSFYSADDLNRLVELITGYTSEDV